MEITGIFQKASDIKTFESGFQAQELKGTNSVI